MKRKRTWTWTNKRNPMIPRMHRPNHDNVSSQKAQTLRRMPTHLTSWSSDTRCRPYCCQILIATATLIQLAFSHTESPYYWRYFKPFFTYIVLTFIHLSKSRDLAAISPTGTGKTLSYLLPIMASLGAPSSSANSDAGAGVRAIVVAPTRELAHQIHNECLKLAEGRKWRIVLFSKASAATLADKSTRDKIGEFHFALLNEHSN